MMNRKGADMPGTLVDVAIVVVIFLVLFLAIMPVAQKKLWAAESTSKCEWSVILAAVQKTGSLGISEGIPEGCKAKQITITLDDLKKKHSEQDITTELEKIRLVANIDVQGGVIGSNFESALGPAELSASVKLLAKELGVAFSTSGGPGTTDGIYSSDNASYSSVGIPSVSFIRGGGGGGHSVEDSIEWLSSDALGLQGRFIERFLTRYVAEAATFPFERVIPPEARQAIERYYKNRMEKPPGSD
jgi:hypothetical protein